MEGGNEAQSQGEGVAEFRALQEQQRVLRKTYDDLRGAVMGTANAAARGRARAEAKLRAVLESSTLHTTPKRALFPTVRMPTLPRLRA